MLIYTICVLPVPDSIKINKFKFRLMLKEKKKKKPSETHLQSIQEYNFIINLSSVHYNYIT